MTDDLSEETPKSQAAPDKLQAPLPVAESPSIEAGEPIAEQNTKEAASQEAMFRAVAPIEAMLAMERSMAELLRLSEAREQMIVTLNSQVDVLRQGELRQAMAPMVKDLIWLFDDLDNVARSYSQRDGLTIEDALRTLDSFRASVGDILERYGIEPIAIQPGDTFDPKISVSVKVRHSEVQAEDRLISKVLKVGFRQDTKVLRAAHVEVIRHKSPENPDNTGEKLE